MIPPIRASNTYSTVVTGVMGEFGATYIAGIGENTGTWQCIYALEDTEIGVLVAPNWDGAGAPEFYDIPLPAGAAIYGYFTTIELNSGRIIAYNVTTTMGL